MINFVKYRYAALIMSCVLICSTLGFFVYKWRVEGKTFNYSIDFSGGSQFLFKFDKPISSSDILSTLEKKGFDGAITRQFSPVEILVRVKAETKDVTALSQEILGYIKEEAADNNAQVLQSDSIGAGIGKELRTQSARAVIIALILMLLYIAWRFWSIAFAIGSVAALFHDAIIMLGLFLLFNREISINVIGAILAVLGYSINDTIVIFSKIKSNLKKMHGAPIEEIVNTSLNQTLKRTLLTSFSTLLTVGSMFFLGGEALRDFSLALLVGIFFGTYSSIYIASPIMMLLYKKSDK